MNDSIALLRLHLGVQNVFEWIVLENVAESCSPTVAVAKKSVRIAVLGKKNRTSIDECAGPVLPLVQLY